MASAVKKQIDVIRLRADLAAAGVELLSAQCAADRVRLQYAPEDIVSFGERHALKRAIASVEALHRFFSEIKTQIEHRENRNSGAE
jgi:hypothetical protein